MRWNGKTLIGLTLILFGFVALFGGENLFGIGALLLALLFIVYGAKKLTGAHSGFSKALGFAALIVGLMFLAGGLPFLIGLIIAVVCIWGGWRLMKNGGAPAHIAASVPPHPGVSGKKESSGTWDSSAEKWEPPFEDEWKAFLRRNHDQKNQDR